LSAECETLKRPRSDPGPFLYLEYRQLVRTSNDGPIITLRRIKEDRCRESRPEGTELRWSFDELGLAPGSRPSVENPYQLPPT
jgi:hypothetical protein